MEQSCLSTFLFIIEIQSLELHNCSELKLGEKAEKEKKKKKKK